MRLLHKLCTATASNSNLTLTLDSSLPHRILEASQTNNKLVTMAQAQKKKRKLAIDDGEGAGAQVCLLALHRGQY